jgi:hypothetical protein
VSCAYFTPLRDRAIRNNGGMVYQRMRFVASGGLEPREGRYLPIVRVFAFSLSEARVQQGFTTTNERGTVFRVETGRPVVTVFCGGAR